jgi:hypothetical protein
LKNGRGNRGGKEWPLMAAVTAVCCRPMERGPPEVSLMSFN